MLNWIVSLLLYIGSFIIGVYIDFNGKKNLRKYYILWLFIFLCFGYMTGTDWRNYEVWYDDFSNQSIRMITEPFSMLFFYIGYSFSVDFWILVGVAKCAYLLSSIKLLSTISNRWLSCCALMIIEQYSFLLICNPLRFMLGLIFINFALIIVYKSIKFSFTIKDILIIFTLLCIAVLFHNSCILYFPIIFLTLYAHKIANLKTLLLFLLYMIITIMTSNVQLLNSVKEVVFGWLGVFFELKDYSNYEAESSNALFSIGNILRIVFFIFILVTKNKVIQCNKDGIYIYGFAVIYCFIARLCILIPTGFRIPMPLSAFYILYIVLMMKTEKFLWKTIVFYMVLSFSSKAWKAFEYIPYSNSIPYIVGGHIPFEERYFNNFEEGLKRNGKYDERFYLY